MLSAIWVLLSIALSIGQLLLAAQTDWMIRGPMEQGLYALCYHNECQFRTHPTSMFLLAAFLVGVVALGISVLFTLPFLIFTDMSKPVELAANIQLMAGTFPQDKGQNGTHVLRKCDARMLEQA